MTDSVRDQLARRNVLVLTVCQAVLGSQMPMIFIVGGLIGQTLAPNVCFATLPISMIVLGSMLAATPMSAIMQRFGRKAGFFLGAGAGALGGAIGAIALYQSSFTLFLVGSLLSGIYLSSQGFFRFAATDAASEDFHPKAVSYVIAGGLGSAIIGPQLVKVTADAMVIPFIGTYFAVILVNLLSVFLFPLLRFPNRVESAEEIFR